MYVAANGLPDRMRLANRGVELVLSDVCKDCADGSSDLQVIQCNASNVHGYAFGDGYVNVLGKKDIKQAGKLQKLLEMSADSTAVRELTTCHGKVMDKMLSGKNCPLLS